MTEFVTGDAQWAIANFTLLAAIATLITAITAAIAVAVSYRSTRISVQRSVDLAAAKWIFDAHMKLNEEPRLVAIFSEVKWETYEFDCKLGGVDLNSEREHDLNYFLDFLNCVDAALEKNVITLEELDKTSIGYAIKMANRCASITRYREFIAKRDVSLSIHVRAWGAMSPRRH